MKLLSMVKGKALFSAVALFCLATQPALSRQTFNFNSDWRLSSPDKEVSKILKKRPVTLPHAWNEDESFKVSTYEMPTGEVWYRKNFKLPKDVETAISHGDKKVFIEFEGARQAAEVFLNGKKIGLSENGVMAFGFDLTPYLKPGDNLIEVRTDNAWDYKEQATGSTWQWHTKSFNVNYGGIPKNVWLHVTDPVYQTLPLFSNLGTTGTYVYGTEYDVPTGSVTINVESEVHNSTSKPVTKSLQVSVKDADGKTVATFDGAPKTIPAGATATLHAEKRVNNMKFWSWGYGYLYDVTT